MTSSQYFCQNYQILISCTILNGSPLQTSCIYYSFTSWAFLHQYLLMDFYWSLSLLKSPQVTRTVLSILADFNNAVVWMVSARPFISKSSCPFTNPLLTVPRAPITIGINGIFMFHSFFQFIARSTYLSFFSLSFNFTLWSVGTAQSTILQILFFVVDYYKVWSSDRDLVIRLYLKIPAEFMRLIHLDIFLVVYIPFVHMIKFQFLAQFPADHLAHPVVSCLILLLSQSAAFAYYVIGCFISITT